jgi:hypothetical protein
MSISKIDSLVRKTNLSSHRCTIGYALQDCYDNLEGAVHQWHGNSSNGQGDTDHSPVHQGSHHVQINTKELADLKRTRAHAEGFGQRAG